MWAVLLYKGWSEPAEKIIRQMISFILIPESRRIGNDFVLLFKKIYQTNYLWKPRNCSHEGQNLVDHLLGCSIKPGEPVEATGAVYRQQYHGHLQF